MFEVVAMKNYICLCGKEYEDYDDWEIHFTGCNISIEMKQVAKRDYLRVKMSNMLKYYLESYEDWINEYAKKYEERKVNKNGVSA